MLPAAAGCLNEHRMRGSADMQRKLSRPLLLSLLTQSLILSFSTLNVSETGKENNHNEYTCTHELCIPSNE